MTYSFTQPIQSKLLSENIIAIDRIGLEPQLESSQKMAESMYRILQFNKSLAWKENKHVFLARTPSDLLEVFQLRSTLFGQVKYSKDIPGDVEGFNFDSLDECSAILYTKSSGMITGTCRVIFDNTMQLPIEKNYTFDDIKKQGNQIAELSRLAILNTDRGLNQDFKYLVKGAYYIMIDNDMDTLVSVMIPEHYRFYKNFGGFVVEKKLESYIGMKRPFVITSWEVSKISTYFKRLYLGVRKSDSESKGRNRFDQLTA